MLFNPPHHPRLQRRLCFYARGSAIAIVWLSVLLSSSALADARCPATGGTVSVATVDGQLSCIHQFTDEGADAFEVPAGNLNVEVLVVGGGGAGGQADGGGGGGGAGGLVYQSGVVATGSVVITVGAGGSGTGTGGQNGLDSGFGDLVALGGGGGSPGDNLPGLDGGSGGGGSGGNNKTAEDAAGVALQLPEFGDDGGVGRLDRTAEKHAGGGGGGASSEGTKGDAKKNGGIGGPGGDGLCAGGAVLPAWMNLINDGCFAGGGGGTAHEDSTEASRAGAGGLGGGGTGEQPNVGGVDSAATAGVSNSGGGGGAARNGTPGGGGSGVVLVRYLAASNLSIEAGNNQTAAVTDTLPIAPAVKITDPSGNPIGGVDVSFAVASGGGSITPTTPITTNALGVASLTSWTLGTVAGEQTLTATVEGLSGSPLTITATATPGPGERLGMKTQPSPLVSNGQAFATQPVIQLLDVWGNIVQQSGVVVSAVIESGGGVLGGTLSATTDALGLASFSDLSITGVIGQRVLRFESVGSTSISSNIVTVQAGVAERLSLSRLPSAQAQSGVSFLQQPQVQLVDQSGNAVSQAGLSVSTALVSGDPSASLGGTAIAVTDETGRASYTDLNITGPLGDYTLGFTAAGLTGITSPIIQLAAGPPTTLVITQAPSSEVRSDIVFEQQPIIGLRDGFGNPALVSGVAVTASIGSGQEALEGTTTVLTNEQGLAAFSDLLIVGTLGIRTLRFSAEGYEAVTSGDIKVLCGRCANLAMVTQPVDAISGEALPVAPVVAQYDSAGNPTITPRSITVSLAFGPGELAGTTTVTSSGGQATFDDLVISGTTGPYALTFSTDTLTSAQSDVFSLTAGTPSKLSVYAGNNQTARVGESVSEPITARVQDAWDNPVAGVLIDFVVSSGGGSVSPASVVTNPEGLATLERWTLGTTAGTQTLSATSTQITGQSAEWLATALVGPPAQAAIFAGDGQTAPAGTVLPLAPAVRVVDQYGNPISGVAVSFSVESGGGRVLGANPTTNANGVATVGQWRLGQTPGVNTLKATTDGLPDMPVTFSATGVVGPPAQLVIATQPVAAGSGQLLSVQPVVHITDQFGNLTDSIEQIEATLTYEGEDGVPGTMTGTKQITSVSGIAAFTDLVITGPVGVGYEIEFSNETLSLVTSEPMSLSPGDAVALRLDRQPSAFAVNGVVFDRQPLAQLIDGAGNAVPEAGIAVTVLLASGGGALGGTLSALTDAQGRAGFTDLVLTGLIGQRTLLFESSGLTSATSNTITLQAGEAVALKVVGEASSQAQNDVVFPEQPKIQLVDASGNAVAQAGIPVTVSLFLTQADPATLQGTTTVATDASGIASFTDLKITGSVGTFQLNFTAPSLEGIRGDAVEVKAGPPETLFILQQPSAQTREGVVLAEQPIIELRDASGNPAKVAGVVVTVSIALGAESLEGTRSVPTNADGQAVFTDLAIFGVVGTRTLRFVAPGYASVTSNEIEVTCGRCAELAMDQQPIDAVSGEPFPIAPIVGQYDSAGNRTPTQRTITVSLASGPGQLSGTTSVVSSEGQAVFDDLMIEGAEGQYILLFESTNLASVASDAFMLEVIEPTYTITTETSPENSGEVVCDPNPVIEGETTLCRAIPNEAFDFDGWAICEGVVNETTCTLSRVGEDQTVKAVFVLKPLPVDALSLHSMLGLMLMMWLSLELIARRQRLMSTSDNPKRGS